MESVKYLISIEVEVIPINPPETDKERKKLTDLQAFINTVVANWSSNPANQQDLMNMMLGNRGILIHKPPRSIENNVRIIPKIDT